MARIKTLSKFGKNLKRLLKEKDMTQSALSELTGIDGSLISNYVTGKYNPSFEAVVVIADALDCSLDEFRV